MTQESPSKFFPTVSGISGRVPRRTHRIRDGVKIHATRHTFGLTMLKAGATILELMQRLGHSNIATTSRYLNSLASAENRLASHMLNEMGIAEEEESLTLF